MEKLKTILSIIEIIIDIGLTFCIFKIYREINRCEKK